jgi:signal transduction histidine kinase
MLVKLLDNAQKFSDDGSAIRVSARTDEGAVVIAVEDAGRGIPDDMLEPIFEPFVQVESGDSRPAGGMGTGLFLVRSVGSAIGATVGVTSTAGEGSTFEVRLPTPA